MTEQTDIGGTWLRYAGSWTRAAVALLAIGWGQATVSQPPTTATPLFADRTPVALTLTVPLRTLVNRASARPEVEGTISYVDAGGNTVTLDVEVRPRGNSRLTLCNFPPLSLNFKRDQVAGTLFEGQNRIKLATLCKDRDDYRQFFYLEELAYRIYGRVTNYAFRTRLVAMTYADSSRPDRTNAAPAFFIEPLDTLAARVGMIAEDVPEVGHEQHSPEMLAKLTLFHYLIGNTDWSPFASGEAGECCHNTDILMPAAGNGPWIPVPYDFDQSGLVDAEYAEPNEAFKIRNVRTRVFRGLCVNNAHTAAAVARFAAARGEILEEVRLSELDEATRLATIGYLEEAFETWSDPDRFAAEILAKCRG